MKLAAVGSLGVRCWLPHVLSIIIAVPANVWAQQPPAPPPNSPAPLSAMAQNFRVIPLAGNNEFNDLQRKVMAPLVVNVLDQNGRPMDGVEVVFRFPLRGPSATFANQASSLTVRTNADGQAAATGWTANDQVGPFRVLITATRGTEMGEAAIVMTNVARAEDVPVKPPARWWSSKWVKIAIIAGAAGAAGGTVWATRNGNSGPAAATPVIIGLPGSPTIGGPR